MSSEVDTIHELKDAFLKLFPGAVPGNNGNISSFTSLEKELHSLNKGVGVKSLAGHVILKLSGKDVLDFLHRVSTNNVKDLGVFKHVNTLFTNEKGRLIDRTTLLKIGDYFLLVGNPDPDERLKNWLEKYIIMEDIVVEDVTREFTVFEFYGKQINSFMTMLCGDKIDNLDGKNITTGDTDSIKSYVTKIIDRNSIEKFWVIVSAVDSVECAKYINEQKSVFNLNFIGDKSFEHFRIKNGLLSSNEINSHYNPHEVGLIDEVSFSKGCYIGQEVIARLDTYDKVQREIKGIKIGLKNSPNLPVQLILEDGSEVGEITSLSNSELNLETIGLALVRKRKIENTEKIFAKISDEEKVEIRLVDLPIEE